MLDEAEFLGPHGIRAISRYHAEHPYIFDIAGQEFRVDYEPAESHTGMFGGNSNWRGPVWFPMNVVILRGLRQLHLYYGDNLKVECPTGSGNEMNLLEVAQEIGRRLASTFLRGADGRRPVFGGIEQFQSDPALERAAAVPRVLPRRQRRRPGRQPSDRLDGPRGADVRPGLAAQPGRARAVAVRGDLTCAFRRAPRSTRSIPPSGSSELGRRLGRPIGLAEVPAGEWDRLAALSVDAVWLMGVWQRSPAGVELARASPGSWRLSRPRSRTCARRT